MMPMNSRHAPGQWASRIARLGALEHHLEAILVTLRREVIEPAKQVLDEERA